MRGFIGTMAIVGTLLAGGAGAQPPVSCEDEIRSLRWLVQRYGSERTTLEFALAASEARRQAAEAELARLKSAPSGQK